MNSHELDKVNELNQEFKTLQTLGRNVFKNYKDKPFIQNNVEPI